MTEGELLCDIRDAIRRCGLIYSEHVAQRILERKQPNRLQIATILTTITSELLERYVHRGGPVALVRGSADGRVGHVVCCEPRPEVCVITAYWPSPDQWDAEFRRRVQGT
ncbi:MAG: DUF4258 domain-containing protein [Chloroflexota bacterium]